MSKCESFNSSPVRFVISKKEKKKREKIPRLTRRGVVVFQIKRKTKNNNNNNNRKKGKDEKERERFKGWESEDTRDAKTKRKRARE